ncbi:MAG: ATP-binding protein [Sideroxydans sp.]|jgi:PAS domain S-box-containing protein
MKRLAFKLISGYLLIALLMVGSGYFGIQIVKHYTTEVQEKAEVLFPNIAILSDIKFAAEGIVGTTARIAYLEREGSVHSGSQTTKQIALNEKEALEKKLTDYKSISASSLEKLDTLVQTVFPDEKEFYESLQEAQLRLLESAETVLDAQERQHRANELAAVNAAMSDAEEAVLASADRWIERERDEFEESTKLSSVSVHQYVDTIFLMSFLALIIGLMAGLWAERYIARPIARIKRAAAAVGAGELDVKLSIKGHDEIAVLGQSFNKMVDRLRESTVSRSYVDSLIRSIVDGLIVLNEDLTIRSINQTTVALTGYREIDLLGRPFDLLLGGGDKIADILDDIGFVENQLERQFVKQDGDVLPVSLSVAKIAARDGGGGVIVLWRDISEQVALIASLRKATGAAEEANRAKSSFLASMSHELRTPMNAILGFSQLLGQEKLSADQKLFVTEIHKAGDHLMELINEVLDLARIESGKVTLSIEPVDLNDVVEQSVALMNSATAKAGISLVSEIDSIERHTVMADRVRLRQVLLNLLSNAIKYNVPNGTVHVRCSTDEQGWVRITVVDSGRGIPKERQAEVFSPFNRLGVEGLNIEGTGIGLTITKDLSELMGGRIGFESEAGKGSQFWVEFPKTSAAIDVEKDETSAQLIAMREERSGKSVLYIEDNPVNLRLVEFFIAKMPGVQFYSAYEALRGLELAFEKCPDLILLDINLPGMDGFEALKRLRKDERTRSIPVYAVSANAMAHDIENALLAGFDSYITKPINAKAFTEAVKQALNEA